MRCSTLAVRVVVDVHDLVFKNRSLRPFESKTSQRGSGQRHAPRVYFSGYPIGRVNLSFKIADSTAVRSPFLWLVSNNAPCIEM